MESNKQVRPLFLVRFDAIQTKKIRNKVPYDFRSLSFGARCSTSLAMEVREFFFLLREMEIGVSIPVDTSGVVVDFGNATPVILELETYIRNHRLSWWEIDKIMKMMYIDVVGKATNEKQKLGSIGPSVYAIFRNTNLLEPLNTCNKRW